MAKSTESTAPHTPPTETALPPAGAAETTDGAGVRPVPAPVETRGEAPARRRPRSPARGNGRPTDPAEMRREIERTRARMSDTLDALEARIEYERESLERKKSELVDRATLKGLRRKLSREPWRSMAIAFAAGYIIAAIRD